MIFGIGCSFTETSFGIAMPKGKTIIHSTLDPNHINKDVEARIGLVGDAGLVLDALLEEIGKTVTADRNASAVTEEIAASHKEWLAKWMPKLTHNDAPLNPYRVLWDLQHTVDIHNTIITHDAGSPRDQLSPFWKSVEPLSSISAGARPRSSATASGWRWAPNWQNPTSFASMSGAMLRSASRGWISRPRCASGFRSCRSCSTISRWRSS